MLEEEEGMELLEISWMDREDTRERERQQAMLETMRMSREDHRQISWDKWTAKFGGRSPSMKPPAPKRR